LMRHSLTYVKKQISGVPKLNCRKCGKWFCDDHVSCKMRLNPSDASHNPHSGVWCRVCTGCFESREGFRDWHGMLFVLLMALFFLMLICVGLRGC
jgi:hypothetical protein